MIGLELSVSDEEWLDELAKLDRDVASKVIDVLTVSGIEAVSFLRSLTGETRPGVRAGDPPRRAHPGGWADITGNLSNAYAFEVLEGGRVVALADPGPTSGTEEAPVGPAPVRAERRGAPPADLPEWVGLLMKNDWSYAVFLEQKDGYYILAGITDEGAPLDRALVAAAARLGFEVG